MSKPATPDASPVRWQAFLSEVANGAELDDALMDSSVTRAQMERSFRTSAERQLEYEEARTSAIRAEWSQADLEAVMDNIALSEDEDAKAVVEKTGKSYIKFLRLVERDVHVNGMYAEAQKLWAERKFASMLSQQDDFNKQKFDALKWIVGVLNDKFNTAKKAEKDQGNVLDLEAKLESARQRVEDLHREREKGEERESVFG